MTHLESMKINLEDERNRISSSSLIKENDGFVIEYITTCRPGCGEVILNEAKNILLLINKNTFPKWPDLDGWLSILPRYFIDSFSDDDWIFENWIYWFEPENRFWFLWSLEPVDDTHLKISILVHEHPFLSEALEVLFMKLGTDELEEINIY